MADDLAGLRQTLAGTLPGRIHAAVAGYEEFTGTAPPADAKGFAAWHAAAKAALAHVDLLVKLARWAEGSAEADEDAGMERLLAGARARGELPAELDERYAWQVLLGRDGNDAVIRVVDSGIGIAGDFLPYVFDRFRQQDASISRRHGGLGLGLSIARQLVELHGGTIAVDSAGPHTGTTFTVRLPLAPAPAVATAPAGPHADAPARDLVDLSGMRILVVDDAPDTLDVRRRMISPLRASSDLPSPCICVACQNTGSSPIARPACASALTNRG
jgi:hypothetical protein